MLLLVYFIYEIQSNNTKKNHLCKLNVDFFTKIKKMVKAGEILLLLQSVSGTDIRPIL